MRHVLLLFAIGCGPASQHPSARALPAPVQHDDVAKPAPPPADAPPDERPLHANPPEPANEASNEASNEAASDSRPPVAGHPYLARLLADVNAALYVPLVGRASGIGCLVLAADGTVTSVELGKASGTSFDASIMTALKTVQADRAAHPVPVPPELERVTKTKICFRLGTD